MLHDPFDVSARGRPTETVRTAVVVSPWETRGQGYREGLLVVLGFLFGGVIEMFWN